MKHRHLIVLLAVTLIALAPTTQARADMAPPEPPAGGSLDTGEPSTYVQMVSEYVLITVDDNGADIKATFSMFNQSTEEETLDVRFPAGIAWGDASGNTYQFLGVDTDSFVIHVEGEKTNFDVIKDDPGILCCWVTWQVAFPPKQEVRVEVSYRAFPARGSDDPFPVYWYILETGAGWYGTIKEGTITLQMPYEISEYNIPEGRFSDYSARYTITGTDIVWHFTNLEPTSEDNFSVVVMAPFLWREWQAIEKAVRENPDSVSEHLRLAHVLSKAAYYVGGGCFGICELFRRALREYELWLNVIPDEYVLQVIPNIADYYLDYIDLLKWGYGDSWDSYCQELRHASVLFTDDKRFSDLKAQSTWCADESPYPTTTLYAPPGCDPLAGRCPPPTATPTVTPVTPNPTSTPRPTRTLTLMPTPTATPTPTPQPPSPNLTLGTLVGIAAVVIAGAGIGLWAYRGKTAGD